MKKILKNTLWLVALVICLVGIFAVASSAAGFTGTTASSNSSVASITSGGRTYYYNTFKAALVDARANSPAEIVVLKNTSGTSDATVYSGYDITVKGANANVVLTMPAKTFASGAGSLKFEDIVLNMTSDSIYYPNTCKASVSFNNVKMNLNGNYNMEIGASGADLSVTMVNCEIIHASPSDTAYFVYAPKSTLTYNISGLKTNTAIFYSDVAVSVDLTLTDINKTTNYPLIRGTTYTVSAETYGNDSTAKQFGYTHRVGGTEGGKVGEVYFAASEHAFASAGNKKVYNITGSSPVEEQPPQSEAGDTQQTADHVAAVSCNGTTYYYTDIYAAIRYARSVNGATVTLLKSITVTDYKIFAAYLIETMGTAGGITLNSNYVFVYADDAYRASGADADTVGSHDIMNAIDLSKLINNNSTKISKASAATGSYKVFLGVIDAATRAKANAIGLKMNEAAIVVDGNNVMLLAWNDAALDILVDTFVDIISDTQGAYKLPKNISGKFVVDESWRDDFTKPATGNLWAGQYVNDNSVQYVYDGYNTTAEGQAAYNAYIAQLKKDGYTEVWSNTIGTNLFALYTNATKKLSLYVAYHDYAYKEEYLEEYARQKSDPDDLLLFNADLSDNSFENRDHHKTLRIISMPTDTVPVPDKKLMTLDMSYTKVTDTKMTMVGLSQSNVGTCYVYMLEDGRFVVIDGGSGTSPVANIYNAMTALYKQAYGKTHTQRGEKLHIAAWYLTHPHSDHAHTFYNFVKQYGSQLKMDYMLANIPAENSIMTNPLIEISNAQIKEMQTAVGGFEMLRVQTGQKVYLANLEIEVLMTYEDHAPFNITTTNDVNVVTRFNIHNKDAKNGETTQVLNLGDAWRHTSRFLCEMYGDYMQTEIVQIAHHGNVGCERALYEAISPRAALVANGSSVFQSYLWFDSVNGNAFSYAADVWCATNVEYMWSAPEGTYNTLTFKANRADYENITDYVNGKKLTESDYTSYTNHKDRSKAGNYIHNVNNAYVEVNVYWGDMSFTYTDDAWSTDGDNKVVVENVGNMPVSFRIEYTANADVEGITGTFKQNGATVEQNRLISLGVAERKEYELVLATAIPPTDSMNGKAIGTITVTIE